LRKSGDFAYRFRKTCDTFLVGGEGSGRRSANGIRRRSVGDIPSIVLADLVGAAPPALGASLERRWVLPGRRVTARLERVRENAFSCVVTEEALDGCSRSRECKLPLFRIVKNYGGAEFYLACTRPSCGRTAKTLHLDGLELLCRRCARLAYPSQRRSPHERRLARFEQVGRLLEASPGEEPAGLRRPSGMRQKRFEALRDEYRRLEAELKLAEDARFRDLLARLERDAALPPTRREIPESEPEPVTVREELYWELKDNLGLFEPEPDAETR
jgi:hypothetical protein